MAITRLTDIITVFDSKWTYGDVKFGYETEVNQEHDTKYPLMLVEPPSSIIPAIYDGREEYGFEINFYNLYSQDAQSVVELQKRWDNLQDLANEWLDFVLKNYQDTSVEAYLNDESIEIERVKEVANDRLVQIKLTFTMSAFTKCFRPVSNYPTDYSGCVLWLKADSGVNFSIPTKKVSTWADQTTNGNNFSQATSSAQPLRYGYDGSNDKTYINFRSNAFMTCDKNAALTGSFTIFAVGKSTDLTAVQPYFSYYTAEEQIVLGTRAGKPYFNLKDDNNHSFTDDIASTTDYNIIRMDLTGGTGVVHIQNNNSSIITNTISGWTGVNFNQTPFKVGVSNTTYLNNANIEEVIVFNRVLSAVEMEDVKGYLNLKYKIY